MKETTDVWLMAFLMRYGFEIKNYSVIARGKVKCVFEIDDSKWKELKLEFHKSEAAFYKTAIEKLKDLSF